MNGCSFGSAFSRSRLRGFCPPRRGRSANRGHALAESAIKKAARSSGRSGQQVWVRAQPEDSENARSRNSANAAGARDEASQQRRHLLRRMAAIGTKRTNNDVRYPVAIEGWRTSREPLDSAENDPLRHFQTGVSPFSQYPPTRYSDAS